MPKQHPYSTDTDNDVTSLILGIETSCDETAAAVLDLSAGIRSNVVFSQIALQSQYGGVVPEIASRAHIEKIRSIVQQALEEADCTLSDINAIAVTNKPGLAGSLLVGLSFAKAIAYSRSIPIIGINHLYGHIASVMIDNDVPFPYICLTASGGHTSMYWAKKANEYVLIGSTLDDAAGEAFDKIAKLLNLPYPGGPIIERLAKGVDFKDFYHYPRARKTSLNFSFSGLKTAILYDLIKRGAYDLQKKSFLAGNDQQLKAQVASSLLCAITDIFADKLSCALKQYLNCQAITFVGGCSRNTYMREKLNMFAQRRNLPFFTPAAQYCTDNAAMIAYAARERFLKKNFDDMTLDIY